MSFDVYEGGNQLEKWLDKLLKRRYMKKLEAYALEGVAALAATTPKDTGLTASSWSYEIENTNGRAAIYWTNSNINQGVPIAVILQYGHGTGTGGYVQGIDYINPAMRPVFDSISQRAWRDIMSD